MQSKEKVENNKVVYKLSNSFLALVVRKNNYMISGF